MSLQSKLIQSPHGFFTRGHDTGAVCKKLGVQKFITAKQIHSNIAHYVAGDGQYEGDALVTDVPGVAVGVYTADCGPVLMWDKVGVVAAVHAGWKGARYGIIESAVKLMKEKGAKNIVASLGPCIAQRSYEVSAEFRDNFLAENKDNKKFFIDSKRSEHFMFDLPGYIQTKLIMSGIKIVEVMSEDTLSQPDKFCSFRRATLAGEKDAGRQISAIYLK